MYVPRLFAVSCVVCCLRPAEKRDCLFFDGYTCDCECIEDTTDRCGSGSGFDCKNPASGCGEDCAPREPRLSAACIIPDPYRLLIPDKAVESILSA